MAEVTINGRAYRADKMPASVATRNLARLTKLIGPALPKLSGMMSKSESARDNAALAGISDLLMNADATDLTNFLVEMAEKAEVKSDSGVYEKVIYDLHFQDDLFEAFQVVAFVLQVNYRSFFSGKLGALINKASSKGAA